MAELAITIKQSSRRYQFLLLLKVTILGFLSSAIVALLVWRLHVLHLSGAWVVGLPLACALAAGTGLVWLVRRRWLPSRIAAARLDRMLGLQERLVTAMEHAESPHSSMLYPRLLEETQSRFSAGQIRMPRPVDRTTGALVILLLLALLWPVKGSNMLKLAQLPRQFPTPQVPPEVRPPPAYGRKQKEKSPQDSMQESGEGKGDQSPEGKNSDRNKQEGQDHKGNRSDNGKGELRDSGGREGKGGEGRRQLSDQDKGQGKDESGSRGRQQRQDESQVSGKERQGEGRPEDGLQPEGARSAKGKTKQTGLDADRRRSSEATREKSASQQGSGHNKGAESSRSSAESSSNSREQRSGRSGSKQQPSSGSRKEGNAATKSGSSQRGARNSGMSQAAGSSRREPSRRMGSSMGNQKAAKEEIQQMLKELSGELERLEAELKSKAADQPHPQAGTSTDPNLYGAPMPIDQATGQVLPIQLKTDKTPTKTKRKGSGVGRPSGEVSRSGPEASAEAAELSEKALEETPTSRQAIPPAYRQVFDRLRRDDNLSRQGAE